jgi:hypothetical protein
MKNLDMNPTDHFYKTLNTAVDTHFSRHFARRKEIMENQTEPQPIVENTNTSRPRYDSIEQYTATTGQRFRMTKDQKQRGLSREAAFAETHMNGANS